MKMKLLDSQKKVISNIFRDLTKLTVAVLVIGQFAQGKTFSPQAFFGGIITSIFMGLTAISFAPQNKEEEKK